MGLQLILITVAKYYFQIKSHSQLSGVKISTRVFGKYNSDYNKQFNVFFIISTDVWIKVSDFSF